MTNLTPPSAPARRRHGRSRRVERELAAARALLRSPSLESDAVLDVVVDRLLADLDLMDHPPARARIVTFPRIAAASAG